LARAMKRAKFSIVWAAWNMPFTLLDVTHEVTPVERSGKCCFRKPIFKIKQLHGRFRTADAASESPGLRRGFRQTADNQSS